MWLLCNPFCSCDVDANSPTFTSYAGVLRLLSLSLGPYSEKLIRFAILLKEPDFAHADFLFCASLIPAPIFNIFFLLLSPYLVCSSSVCIYTYIFKITKEM